MRRGRRTGKEEERDRTSSKGEEGEGKERGGESRQVSWCTRPGVDRQTRQGKSTNRRGYHDHGWEEEEANENASNGDPEGDDPNPGDDGEDSEPDSDEYKDQQDEDDKESEKDPTPTPTTTITP
ncbi:hypothetical protein F5890DRAFT_1560443 [Lentinula detonsa]|uniref:Uncharacterized protein n=1 Tax=Lentinula detonsa TaxID=2804962 RepID=A0AA38ULN0_9AGAR|nr:hypothetical protein F5890DRAFT_1560443 [Lentinula detonsa]